MKEFKIYHSLRANKNTSKVYLNKLVEGFAPLWAAKCNRMGQPSGVQICKQDLRGCLSISLCLNDCISNQIHFINQAECVAYMQGFMFAVKG